MLFLSLILRLTNITVFVGDDVYAQWWRVGLASIGSECDERN